MLDEFDALTAAPEHHRVLFENEEVRVVETHIPPGEETKLHTHIWGGPAQILSWSSFIRRDSQGNVMAQSDNPEEGPKPGTYIWASPLPLHTFKNTGDTDVHLIVTELKK